SLVDADEVYLFEPDNLSWSLNEQAQQAGMNCLSSTDEIVTQVVDKVRPHQHILIMSNGGFNGLHELLISHLTDKFN
ncbi:hypothetical protein ACKI2C_52105, partial [Streptomyces brasiliscabiei]